MSLFNKQHQNITIDDYDKSMDNSILYVRAKVNVTDKEAYFEVPQTHDALLVKGGGNALYYTSGRYPVFADKQEVKDWKTGSTVEIIYIAKEAKLLVQWGTPETFIFKEKLSHKLVHMGANGEFKVYVQNAEQFRRRVVGRMPVFDAKQLRRELGSYVADQFIHEFFTVVDELNLTYERFDANLKLIAGKMQDALNPRMNEEYGLEMTDFILKPMASMVEPEVSRSIEEEEEKAKREQQAKELAEKREKEEKELAEKRERQAKEAAAERERLEDKNFEREMARLRLEREHELAMAEIAATEAVAKASADKKVEPPKKVEAAVIFCPQCGASCKRGTRFCPECGRPLGPTKCPKCGHINSENAKFCVECGVKLR